MRILLVEDDPVSLSFLKAFISKLGHEVHSAADGETAWRMYQSGEYQLIVSDWNMPGFSGLDLCAKIRAAGSREYTYFILVTSLQGQERLAEAMEAGVDDFLPKPVDMDTLTVRLQVAVRILAFHRQIGLLQQLLPICMYCKKIRDDKDFWVNVESYFKAHTGADFTHSLCPDCHREKIQPQFDALRAENSGKNPKTD